MMIPSPLLAALLVAALPSPALPADLDELVRTGPLGHSHSGLEVVCLEDGSVVYASHARELLNPASNTKIFTSAAALSRLGPDYRWTTEVYLEGPLSHGSVQGDLVLRGKGDPTLTSERLWELAAELWHQGLREVKGDLVLDDSYFDHVTEGPGWEQEKTDRAYLAPISALAANWGSFAIYISPGEQVGQRARVEFEPESPYLKLEGQVITRAEGPRRVATAGLQKRDGYHVKVSGWVALGEPTSALWRRVGDPTIYTGETFKQLLSKRGIRIAGRVRRGVRSAGARLFYSAESESLDVVLKRLNKQSSNFIAEMLVKTLAAEAQGIPGSWPNGVEVIEEFLAQDVGIPRGSYTMKNGSGLNDVNRFSAEQVVRVLSYMYPRLTVAPEYLSSLGIAAHDGTVRFRMQGTPAAGRVRAKTGTLEDVSALSGYIESVGGRHFAFSILVNDFPSSLRRAVAAEDAFAVTIASAGSSGAAPRDASEVTTTRADQGSTRDRAARYVGFERHPQPADVPVLKEALVRETDPALRTLAAEALYVTEADEPEAAEALLDELPGSAETLGRVLALSTEAGGSVPLVSSLVDLVSCGNPRGLVGLLGLAAIVPDSTAEAQAPWNAGLASGLSEIALQTPIELLSAMSNEASGDAARDVASLAQGLAANPEASARFSAALAHAVEGPAKISDFAKVVRTLWAKDPTHGTSDAGPPPESVGTPAAPRHSPRGQGG